MKPRRSPYWRRARHPWQRILDDDATLELTTGVILRCDGTDDNWLMMGLSAGRETGTLFIAKRVGGAAPEIIEPIDYSPYLAGHDVPYRIVANVNTDGTYTMYIGKTKVLDGFDPDLQAGQPLEEGQAGIFDGYAGAGFPTVGRVYSNFATWVPP